MVQETPRTCWDRIRACKMLGIPYRIVDMDKDTGGFSNLMDRYIKINKECANDDRVWVHELAHTILHYQYVEAAAGRDQRLNAMAELEADTVAYIACKKLGCEDRKTYLNYMKVFMSRLPAHEQTPNVLDARMPKLLNIVNIILKSGGYYA